MEASTLRWIIIVIGVIILAAIFLFGNPEKKRTPRASRRKPLPSNQRREPSLDANPDSAQSAAGEGAPTDTPPGAEPGLADAGAKARSGQGELPIRAVPSKPEPPRKPRKPAGPPPDKIITLFLLARDNHRIGGAELLEAALKTGMTFGEMDIFHRLADGSEQPVFSLANAISPGHFDKDAWNTFETGGVAVFMTLPGPMLALDAWDAMLATARRIAEILQAEIRDGDRVPFTRQKEAETREEMRQYDREKARQSLS